MSAVKSAGRTLFPHTKPEVFDDGGLVVRFMDSEYVEDEVGSIWAYLLTFQSTEWRVQIHGYDAGGDLVTGHGVATSLKSALAKAKKDFLRE